MFTNDLFTIKRKKKIKKGSNWLKTNIGDNVKIGSNTTILPVNICSNVIIGAGSLVTKDITKPGIYGSPATFKKKII